MQNQYVLAQRCHARQGRSPCAPPWPVGELTARNKANARQVRGERLQQSHDITIAAKCNRMPVAHLKIQA